MLVSEKAVGGSKKAASENSRALGAAAVKSMAFLIKPASSACNLRCKYCFYEDEAENRSQAYMGAMTAETAEILLTEAYRTIAPKGSIRFSFQGGEPTIAGLPFFQNFVHRARELKPPRVDISFSIQTNGTQVDETWARFFRDQDFLVGISLDGAKDLHDAHRVDARRKGTWELVQRKATLLQKHEVKTNALCVVTAQAARSPQRIYQGLKKLGFRYIQFIACLDPIGCDRGQMPWSLLPEAYGRFLCTLFDLWYRDWEQGKYHSIRLFDDYIHILTGDEGSACATCGRCGEYYVVEADGSIYPCDFYALDRWKLGRLGEDALAEMAQGEVLRRFLAWGSEKPGECTACSWRMLCSGGCKNDWISGEDGPHNYYCKSFQMLFEYGADRMKRIAWAEREARRQLR